MIKKTTVRQRKWDDHWAQRAREENWLARSVFKLQEIDQKFGLIRQGDYVLDLGCYPGSWSQYGIRRVGPVGQVVGIDVKRPEHFSAPNFRFIQADVLALDLEWLVREVGRREVVISDLAPQTSGIKSTDTSRSLTLATKATEIAFSVLKTKGHFLCKVFEGEDFKPFQLQISTHFRQVRALRPSAVRKGSREIYVIGLGFRMPEIRRV